MKLSDKNEQIKSDLMRFVNGWGKIANFTRRRI